ncbi:MAG: M23 family metallopeptidase [Myxococcota bacterium]
MNATLGRPKRKGRSLAIGSAILVVLILAAVVWSGLRTGSAPTVRIEASVPALGRQTPVSVRVGPSDRGFQRLQIGVRQGQTSISLRDEPGQVLPVWSLSAGRPESEHAVVVRADELGFEEGPATVWVDVEAAGTWLWRGTSTRAELELPVQLRPPSLARGVGKVFVAQGGSEVVRYSVGPRATRHGVKVRGAEFPGHPLPGTGDCFAFFALPYDFDRSEEVMLFAEDVVGNRTEAPFIDQFISRPPTRDTIRLSDSVLEALVPRIMARVPSLEDRGNIVDNYVQINADLRKALDEELVELGKRTVPAFQWNQTFIPMPAKVVSSFADVRAYWYQGKVIDRQTHLGFDLASVRRDRIPAANDGIVVMAEYFGIYGNTLILDHGYGLMSLYGHMSSFEVKPGDRVERGQTIGRTGATGLALGDHLHFTMLVYGRPVSPLEWWDTHWIQDRIASKLESALSFRPGDG